MIKVFDLTFEIFFSPYLQLLGSRMWTLVQGIFSHLPRQIQEHQSETLPVGGASSSRDGQLAPTLDFKQGCNRLPGLQGDSCLGIKSEVLRLNDV